MRLSSQMQTSSHWGQALSEAFLFLRKYWAKMIVVDTNIHSDILLPDQKCYNEQKRRDDNNGNQSLDKLCARAAP